MSSSLVFSPRASPRSIASNRDQMSALELLEANAMRRFNKPDPKPRKDWHYKAFKNPYENMTAVAQGAVRKTQLSVPRLVVLGLLGGVFVGLAGIASISAAGGIETAWATRFPAIPKLLSALTFPSGLLFIIVLGAELFTSNIMYMTLGILTGGVSIGRALLILLLSYLTNYLGTAAVAGLTVYYGGLFQNAPYSTYVQNLATSKVISPSFGTLVARAVPANVLVNIAVLMASSAEDIMSKTFGVYIAIGTFVMAGSEHLIANEFYIHAAMFNGAHVGYGVWIWKSVIAVTIGNIIGAFIVGFSYWYIYKAQERLGENHWLITGWPSRKKSEDEEEMGDAKSSTKPSSMETKPSSMETKPTESTRQHSRDKSDKSQQ